VLMDVKTTKEKVFYYPAFTIIKKQFPRIKWLRYSKKRNLNSRISKHRKYLKTKAFFKLKTEKEIKKTKFLKC
jgi:hypothetical protein